MNDRDITRVLERLVGQFDQEKGDWERLLEQLRAVETPGLPRRRFPTPPRRSLLILGAAVAVAVAVALTVASPWRGGPSILDRAAAAIAVPRSDEILYESMVGRLPPPPPKSGVPRWVFRSGGWATHLHVWIQGGALHRFRLTSVSRCVHQVNGCPNDPSHEIGGRIGAVGGLSYDPSSGALYPLAFQLRASQDVLDPAAFVRAALTSGRAQLDGRTTIRGRDVIRVRVSANVAGRRQLVAIYFADANTYRPVRIVIVGFNFSQGFPLGWRFLGDALASNGGQFEIVDFTTYRYLKPTTANRKLADIRAQHPHAKIL
jgi:hypothetical protein